MSSIWDRDACETAAALLKEGFPIGTYIRGVCGLWADGRSSTSLNAIYRIKGSRRGDRPLGTTLASTEFVKLLDADRIAPSVRALFLDARELANRLGSISFLRVPIWEEAGASLPSRLVSRAPDGSYWLQNWLPEGCQPARGWMEALRKESVDLPAVTSMNVSGKPELVDEETGLQFCQEHQVPLFLGDRKSPGRAKGSFPILQVGSEGIALIREGHFPARLFQSLLGDWEIDLSNYQSASFPPVDLPQEIEEAVESPKRLRLQLLEFLDG